MPLPTVFANLTTATGAQLDGNFAALGAISIIPCGVTGTNALSLLPLANVPAVTAYANYMTFSGVAAADNTGPVTAGVGSLGSLGVYKDTAAGPVALAGAEIQAGNLITLTYDAGLNGFHLQTGINASGGTFLALTGGTLSGPLFGTSLSLSGSIAAQNAGFSGGVSCVSVTAVRAIFSGSLSGTTVNIGPPGSAIKNVATVSVASVVYSAVLPNTSADQSIAFPSLNVGDTLMMGLPSLTSVGLSFNAFAASSGTATLRAFNVSASTISGVTLAGVRLTMMQF